MNNAYLCHRVSVRRQFYTAIKNFSAYRYALGVFNELMWAFEVKSEK